MNKQTKPVQPETNATTVQPAQANEDLLDYIARFTDLSADAQKKELVQVLQALGQNKTDISLRSKAAIMYAIPASKVKDNAKAQSLLDDLLKEKTLEAKQKGLLLLIRDFVSDNSKLTSKIKDEQKRSDVAQQKFDAAQQRADALQQKLDELKDIERTMIDRDQKKPK
ncbi:hypothetical protein ZMTM_16170 [Methyloradius palustris]|uniref:Uncharacterized protein n=2 Tax=Methyloradius palustris TaxID=2778876 RepID=A0A8D5G3J0_9PROT|nr:hypothetical protein ZMTM_16170 [Methyloradius palustris]